MLERAYLQGLSSSINESFVWRLSHIYEIIQKQIFSCQINNSAVFYFSCLQKPDSDLTFEDSLGITLSDDTVSNRLHERTKVVSKRSVSEDSDKQLESDESWLSRVKRRLSNYFTKSEGKAVEKRESPKSAEVNQSQESKKNVKFTPRRRRDDDEDDDDEDEDNEISSGDHETTPDADPVTALPPVKDDKYCKLKLLNFCCASHFLFQIHSPS